MKRIYIDGIFDLFHRGHLESLKQAKNIDQDVNLIVGIIDDETASGYKRKPIINQFDRAEIIKNIKIVDEIIESAPLVITREFIEENNIDLVVHGFANDNDWEKQQDFFKYLIENNKFKKINYYDKISTTDIINNIKRNY
jgi:choline-phosphate cytidylyltransferase|tara:strand:+ start:377 stop:796 length:420 start_codon:yes stop_codon:yes gene_type:complete